MKYDLWLAPKANFLVLHAQQYKWQHRSPSIHIKNGREQQRWKASSLRYTPVHMLYNNAKWSRGSDYFFVYIFLRFQIIIFSILFVFLARRCHFHVLFIVVGLMVVIHMCAHRLQSIVSSQRHSTQNGAQDASTIIVNIDIYATELLLLVRIEQEMHESQRC